MMFVALDPEPDRSGEDGPSVDQWFAEVNAAGRWVLGERLRPGEDARTVRSRDGQVLVTEGACSPSTAGIAGFDVLECESMDQAVAIASRHPMARAGRIEIRAFWPLAEPGP